MGENTKIESAPQWLAPLQFADIPYAARLVMLNLMTGMAKGPTIADLVSKFRMTRKVLYVVRPQVSAAIISTSLTGKVVSGENCSSPIAVFRRSSIIFGPLRFPVLPSVMRRPARRSITRYCAHLFLRFRRMFNTKAVFITSIGGAYFDFCFCRVVASLKNRPATLRALSNLRSGAQEASRASAVSARAVAGKFGLQPPRLTSRTMLFARGYAREIIAQRKTEPLSRNFLYSYPRSHGRGV